MAKAKYLDFPSKTTTNPNMTGVRIRITPIIGDSYIRRVIPTAKIIAAKIMPPYFRDAFSEYVVILLMPSSRLLEYSKIHIQAHALFQESNNLLHEPTINIQLKPVCREHPRKAGWVAEIISPSEPGQHSTFNFSLSTTFIRQNDSVGLNRRLCNLIRMI